jgi:acyl-CoA thioester hydrolase
MYSFDVQKRVRYGETDQMGYLYYGQYAQLYEIGRVELIRSLGISYKDVEDQHNIMMPVMLVESRYLQPAKYDEILTIRTILNELPSKLICFETFILNEEKSIIHKAQVKLFFVDMNSGKRISAPKFLIDTLLPHFEK